MGISTDGILGYGVYFEPYSSKGKAIFKALSSLVTPAVPRSADDEEDEDGLTYKQEMALEKLGFYLTRCCCEEEVHYLLTARDSESVSRGYANTITTTYFQQVADADFGKLSNFLESYGIVDDIGWKLASYWG